MPAFVRPSAISSSTSRSRSVSSASGSSSPRGRDEARDHLRVERRTAVGDALGGGEELADVEHAVLEQVAEAAERDQLDGVGRLDVLGEDEHAQLWVRLLDLPRCARALVGEGRRHPDVQDDEVGIVLGDRGQQPVASPERGDDLVSGVLEQSPEPLAQQHLVLGDHDPHGSSAVSVVPAPWSLSMRSVPPCAATRSARPLRPEPGVGVRAADAVVADRDDELPVLAARR